MRGWKPVERHVPEAMGLDDAKRLLGDEGLAAHVEHPQRAIPRRPGTRFAMSGRKFPLEATVACADEGLYLRMRCDAFEAFDTGDLDRMADEMAARLRA